jgi:hypothetical protein
MNSIFHNMHEIVPPEKTMIMTVRKMAWSVRRKAESYARANGIDSHDLDGMCGISSVALILTLRENGISATLHGRRNHWWVEIADSIIDITATQFGNKQRVLVIDKRKLLPGAYKYPNRYGLRNKKFLGSPWCWSPTCRPTIENARTLLAY